MEVYLAVGGVVIAFLCLLCFFNWLFKPTKQNLPVIVEDLQTGLTGPGKDLKLGNTAVVERGSLESIKVVNPISASHYSLTDPDPAQP
jgi:hypothetical protein